MITKLFPLLIVALAVSALDNSQDERMKRSPEEKKPWELNPNINRDQNGNVQAGVTVERKGENADVHAGWSKVVNGPNKAKPTWNVGGTIRWRRSVDEEETNPEDIARFKRTIQPLPGNKYPWEKNGKPNWNMGGPYRFRRSPANDQPWELNPNVARDEHGNVITDVNIKRTGENGDIHAGWSKVVDGPNRAKPTWNVGGTIRWRRSVDEEETKPEDIARYKRTIQPLPGNKYPWEKNGKPNWNMGGPYRFRRSPANDQPWELNPNVARDEHGNVITDVSIKRTGENGDIHAGWSKVVDGPNRAKPTWNVGGTIRWRRSVDEDETDTVNEDAERFKRSPANDQPWELNPNVARDEHGNVITGVNIKRTGENGDIHAGWSKVVDGPNRAKPTWNVGGTIRWRRSVDEEETDTINEDAERFKRSPANDQPWKLNPNVARDEHGNVITDVNIKRTGENGDFHAGWSEVVDGPNRAKPTWNVGGTIRWRRSVDEEETKPEDIARYKRTIQPLPGNKYPWEKNGKPNWNMGGPYRFRRSPANDQPWELNPNVARDQNGNVVADINVKRTGENGDIHAGWSKVVDGPNRAKPTWNVGGTIKW